MSDDLFFSNDKCIKYLHGKDVVWYLCKVKSS